MDGSEEERLDHRKGLGILGEGKVQVIATGEGIRVHHIEKVGGEKLFELVQCQTGGEGGGVKNYTQLLFKAYYNSPKLTSACLGDFQQVRLFPGRE